jgi:hypothetical protein
MPWRRWVGLVALLGLCGLCGCIRPSDPPTSNFYNYNGKGYVIGIGGTYGSSGAIFEYTPGGGWTQVPDSEAPNVQANGQPALPNLMATPTPYWV